MITDGSSRRLDLDGLQVFEAVMRERNVTRAAVRLSLTQPAVSHALARLRILFGDPLFIRSPGGVRPTRRAEELWLEVQQPMNQLRRAISPGTFDPAAAEFSVSIAVNDMITQEIMTPWCARLRHVAPGLKLSMVMRTFGDSEARLLQGTLDFGLGLFSSLPDNLRRQEVWSDSYVCAFRRSNPIASLPWTLETFDSATHIRVMPNGERFNVADVGVRIPGTASQVALLVSHFTCVPGMLQATDMVALLPRFYVTAVARQYDLEIRELPYPNSPVKYELVWHERAERSQPLMWFRDDLLRELRPR
ncbi:LysR family transcriptional regulator [soil metagenome]